MNNKFYVSFFIPAYNCASTIEEAVDSIVETNFSEGDELIIVNDCSTDDTAQALARCKKKHAVIKVIHHSRNKGGAGARNTAIEHSSNELLFCLDSDNVLSPNSIDPLKRFLLENNADAASFQHQHFFSSSLDKIQYTWTLNTGIVPENDFLNGSNTPAQHGNYLFTKQSWQKAQGYCEGVGALDTWTFGLRQMLTGAKFVVLANSFYYHRLQDTSYYINDAHKKMWSVSVKITYSLLPFIERIDERFVKHMFKNRYTWFYDLKKTPILLVDAQEKSRFYEVLQAKLLKQVYPPLPLYKRLLNKLYRIFKATK